MVTVLRSLGLRVVIYLNDHEPAHVHVYGDGQARIDLAGARPAVIEQRRMTKGELRKALALVAEHQAALLRRWEEIHG
ncbi:MAG TPA: DUF4160 domain-containing protein [Aurantimonas sp.]